MRFFSSLLILLASTAAFADEPLDTFCDINGDGRAATVADYIVWFNAYGGSTDDPYFLAWADLNRDRAVNTTDYGILLRLCPLSE